MLGIAFIKIYKGLLGIRLSLIANAQQIITIIGRTSLDPNRTVTCAPSWAPRNEPIAIEMAIGQMISPLAKKTESDPILHDAFASFVKLIALIRESPQRATNPTMKNDPTPGPNTPS